MSCLSASGEYGWSEAASVEMKGLRGNTAQQDLCFKMPTGIKEQEHCWNKKQKFRPQRTEQMQTCDTKLKNCAPREANAHQLCLEWVGHAFPVPRLFIRQQLPGWDFLQVYVKEHIMSLDP